jgi:uncharacterized protein (TIGR02271 family)
MLQLEHPERLQGRQVRSRDGEKIGKVSDIYVDEATGRPEWAAIKGGLFRGESLVPLAAANKDGEELVVPYDKQYVMDAPHRGSGDMSTTEEAELFRYFRVPYGGETATATGGPRHASPGTSAQAPSAGRTGQSSRSSDDAMTRSEERMRVGKERVQTGRARLHKYLVTENVTQTVPVTHEEVRVEREPITDTNRDAAMRGEPITESEHEVTLHAERPVAEKETEPVERVRLTPEQVTEEETVSEQVRKERIDAEGIEDPKRRRR